MTQILHSETRDFTEPVYGVKMEILTRFEYQMVVIHDRHKIAVQRLVFDEHAVREFVVFMNHFVLENVFLEEDDVVALRKGYRKKTQQGEQRVPNRR